MKTVSVLVLASVVGIVAASGFSRSAASDVQDPVTHKIEILEQDLISNRQKTEALTVELGETKAALLKTIRYLEAQAKVAQTMETTLDESEKAGFTYGINPESRQVLLKGWREQLSGVQKDVPAMPESKPDAAKKSGEAAKQ
jgi:hypothetical protein